MKILVIGSGGREHTLCWKIKQSKLCKELFCAPGNAGTSELGKNIDIKDTNIEELKEFSIKEKIDLVVVGPETPLADGIVDIFQKEGIKIFGPDKYASQIESSKKFSKELMKKCGIPTASFETFDNIEKAKEYIKDKEKIVIKASGLAAGKGVLLCKNKEEAINAIENIMAKKEFGNAGNQIVIEEFLEGEEASFLAFCDGKTVKPMVSSQDHKAIYENNKGPNTGGMGAYSPCPMVSKELEEIILDKIIKKATNALAKEGHPYKGILYAGLMIKENNIKVLEFNIRFGDPETQVILPRLESDLVEIILACIDGTLNQTEIKWNKNPACCVVLASKGYPGKYEKGKEITGLKEAELLDNVNVFIAGARKENNKILTNGGRILGVTATGETIKEAIEQAYKGVEKILFEKMYYRKDIGHRALLK